MSAKPQLTKNQTNLIRRYFFWCYKTTKEELDKIDRYFTQLQADEFVLKQLRKTAKGKKQVSKAANHKIDQFAVYMQKKESNVLKKKFKNGNGGELTVEYQYTHMRFEALTKAITHFLGAKELKVIEHLYEEEMTSRILAAREHT